MKCLVCSTDSAQKTLSKGTISSHKTSIAHLRALSQPENASYLDMIVTEGPEMQDLIMQAQPVRLMNIRDILSRRAKDETPVPQVDPVIQDFDRFDEAAQMFFNSEGQDILFSAGDAPQSAWDSLANAEKMAIWDDEVLGQMRFEDGDSDRGLEEGTLAAVAELAGMGAVGLVTKIKVR